MPSINNTEQISIVGTADQPEQILQSNPQEKGSESSLQNEAQIWKTVAEQLRNDLLQLKKKSSDLSTSVEGLHSKLKQQISEVKAESREEISVAKSKVTESLAIFVSLFTFISVTFQIFDNSPDPQLALNLLSLLAGVLLLFIILMNLMMRGDISNREKNFNLKKIKTNPIIYIFDKSLAFIANNLILFIVLVCSLLLIFRSYFFLSKTSENTPASSQLPVPAKTDTVIPLMTTPSGQNE